MWRDGNMGKNKINDNWRTLIEMKLIENCLLCKNCAKVILGNYNTLKSASYDKISLRHLLNLFNIKLEITLSP